MSKNRIHYQIFAVGFKKMAKVQIKNRVKEEEQEKLVKDTNNARVLTYLQTFYPWIKIVQDDRYVIFAREKRWGKIYGQVCEISNTSQHVTVDVVGEALATQEFVNFIQSVYGDIDIYLNVVKYVESERERSLAGFG